MADVAKLAAKVCAQFTDLLATPAYFSGSRERKSAEDAQQAGFSGAVFSLQVKNFAAIHAKSDAVEQLASATYAG